VGGTFVAPKSVAGAAEVDVAQEAFRTFGGLLERTIAVDLPDVEPRTLIVIRKTAPTPSRYPRRAGIVQKRPL